MYLLYLPATKKLYIPAGADFDSLCVLGVGVREPGSSIENNKFSKQREGCC